MDKGKIILLYGGSSSGKTTLGKALQERLQEPFYLFSVDNFFHMVSMNRLFTPTGSLNGAIVNQIYKAFHHTIRSFSDMGLHCIVDTVFENTPGINHNFGDFAKQLAGYNVLMVYVHCPPEELRRREEKRGDREIGQAEMQLPALQHTDMNDLAVDTCAKTTDECVELIVNAFCSPENAIAFNTLCRIYQNT